jgi:hypothetical protein
MSSRGVCMQRLSKRSSGKLKAQARCPCVYVSSNPQKYASMKPTAAVVHAFESHLNATCAFSALTVSDVLVRIHLLHSYVPSQSDFQSFYGGFQHLADIDAVIENELFIVRDLVLDLGIVVKDHQLYKAAA